MQVEHAPCILGLHQLVDQCCGGGEAHGNPPLAGGQVQTESDMGLAGAAVTDGNDILAARDVFTAGQLHYQGLVHRGDGREVEGVQALHGGKACRPDPTLHHELVAVAMSSSWANRSRYSG